MGRRPSTPDSEIRPVMGRFQPPDRDSRPLGAFACLGAWIAVDAQFWFPAAVALPRPPPPQSMDAISGLLYGASPLNPNSGSPHCRRPWPVSQASRRSHAFASSVYRRDRRQDNLALPSPSSVPSATSDAVAVHNLGLRQTRGGKARSSPGYLRLLRDTQASALGKPAVLYTDSAFSTRRPATGRLCLSTDISSSNPPPSPSANQIKSKPARFLSQAPRLPLFAIVRFSRAADDRTMSPLEGETEPSDREKGPGRGRIRKSVSRWYPWDGGGPSK